MNPNPKTSRLRSLNEQALRETVLVPLLTRMGLKAVTIYHGPRERGKDIICFDQDRLGRREYLGIVAKVTDLDGSVSSSNSLLQVVHQIEQCFDVSYEDLFGMTRITMDRVWVVTSGRIVSGAADSVYDHLSKRNLSKLVRFISGEHLVQLIDEHYASYWHDSFEPLDTLREQKNRLVQFLRRILVAIGGKEPDIELTINQVINSHFPPSVVVSAERSLSHLSPYSIEFDSIDPEYSHPFMSEYGSVPELFIKAKQAIYHAMFDVDNSLIEYEDVIKKTNPKDLLDGYHRKLRRNYPFSYETNGDAGKAVEYLEYALEEIDRFQQNLRQAGKLEWTAALVDSVARLEDDIRAFIASLDKDEFSLYWRIENNHDVPRLRLLYEDDLGTDGDLLITRHVREIEISNRRQVLKRLVTVPDITQELHTKIREYLDGLLAQAGISANEID